ncbi:hypothetical protein GF342_02920 [Candidatus Woesearchaeota archaeon]|nr:hypothetical protein [Candidatus Woesearchaeota archaeon]
MTRRTTTGITLAGAALLAGCSASGNARAPEREGNPLSFDYLAAPTQTASPTTTARSPSTRSRATFSSHDLGFNYMHEGPVDQDGNPRPVGNRVGIALANTGLDHLQGVPYLSLLVRDNHPRGDMGWMEHFWGVQSDGTGRAHPPWYALPSWVVALPRVIATYHISRALREGEEAAYGDPSDPNYLAGAPVTLVREPFRATDDSIQAFGDNIVGGRNFLDFTSGGYLSRGGSIWDDAVPGESRFRRGFAIVETNAAAGLLIYGLTKGGSSHGYNGAEQQPPTIEFDGGPGTTGR